MYRNLFSGSDCLMEAAKSMYAIDSYEVRRKYWLRMNWGICANIFHLKIMILEIIKINSFELTINAVSSYCPTRQIDRHTRKKERKTKKRYKNQ